MIVDGASMLTQSDGHHFAQAALNISVEVRVWLDSVYHHNVVGLKCVIIQKYWNPLRGFTHLGGVHRCPYRHTDADGCDSVVLHTGLLALRSATAMATHGRDNKRPNAQVAQLIHNGSNDHRDIGNTAASGSDCHRLSRFQPS